MGIYETKLKYFEHYCMEMNAFRGEDIMSFKKAKIAAEYYVNSEQSKWINVFCGEELIGFLIIGKRGREKHPDADYSIAQAYITPPFRHLGMMTKAVSDYLARHPGTWSLKVQKGNDYALKYWEWLFTSNGFSKTELDESKESECADRICLAFTNIN